MECAGALYDYDFKIDSYPDDKPYARHIGSPVNAHRTHLSISAALGGIASHACDWHANALTRHINY
eukprot:2923254-Prymnesium_polylepis.2